MKKYNNTLTRNERRQQIALCAATYRNLYGVMPDSATLCRWLDDSYLAEIIRYLRNYQEPQLLCS